MHPWHWQLATKANLQFCSYGWKSHFPIFSPTFYRGRSCPKAEITLHKDCIDTMKTIGWDLVAHEWDVTHGTNTNGKGDLVFQKQNTYCVIECKRRNSPKVYEQSQYYASAWSLTHSHIPHVVIYGVWTYYCQEIIGSIRTYDEAKLRCSRKSCTLL